METTKKYISISNNRNLIIPFNCHAIVLGIIIFLNLDGFYLLTDFFIAPTDIAVVLEIFYVFYILLTRKSKCKYRFKWAMLMPILLMITSSIMAHYSYNQPLWLGIRAQRTWVCAMLMYFPITKLYSRGELTEKTLLSMLDVVNIIYVLLVFLQYLVGDNILFLNVIANQRYGSIRLYVSLSFVSISYYVHLLNALRSNKIKFIDMFFVVAMVILELAITKSRMAIVCFLAGTIFAILSIRFSTKKLILVLAIIIIAGIFLSSNIGQDILSIAFNNTTGINNTAEIREIGRKFFITQTFKNWQTTLFGCGFANIDWPQTYIGIKYGENIFANDNGIFGLMFYYGLLFVIWLAYFYIRLLINSWKTNRALFCLLIADIISIYSLAPMLYSANISFAIICVILNRLIIKETSFIRPNLYHHKKL